MKISKKILLIILVFFMTGCTKKNSKDDYATIQEKFINMQSYSCSANIVFNSNKGKNEYTINQQAKNDGKYYIEATAPEEIKGNVILFDGNILWQYNPNLNSKISIDDKNKITKKELCLFSFLENHLKSKDIALETANIDKNIYTVLEAEIPGNNKYLHKEKLFINNKTKSPEKLIIYDVEEKERIIIKYSNFVYNPKIDDSKFNIENIENPK